MREVSEINMRSWDAFADAHSRSSHEKSKLTALMTDPATAFHPELFPLLGDVRGKNVLVPSSGDNMAAFALARLGAHVTSTDISTRELGNARRIAGELGLNIEFIQADSMDLDSVGDDKYDLVYTSNGVFVWISDLPAMFTAVARKLKKGGHYVAYELHPFNRPFDDNGKVIKDYDTVGPFDMGGEITHAWRLGDLLNAMISAGLKLEHLGEIKAIKDYKAPFWVPLETQVNAGETEYDHAEVDKMYDWRQYPMAALPQFFTVKLIKE